MYWLIMKAVMETTIFSGGLFKSEIHEPFESISNVSTSVGLISQLKFRANVTLLLCY